MEVFAIAPGERLAKFQVNPKNRALDGSFCYCTR